MADGAVQEREFVMTTMLFEEASLRLISPAAVSGYVRSLNWVKDRPYRDVSDVYV